MQDIFVKAKESSGKEWPPRLKQTGPEDPVRPWMAVPVHQTSRDGLFKLR